MSTPYEPDRPADQSGYPSAPPPQGYGSSHEGNPPPYAGGPNYSGGGGYGPPHASPVRHVVSVR